MGCANFSFTSKSPAALPGVAPTPTSSRHWGRRMLIRHSPLSVRSRYKAVGFPRFPFRLKNCSVPTNSMVSFFTGPVRGSESCSDALSHPPAPCAISMAPMRQFSPALPGAEKTAPCPMDPALGPAMPEPRLSLEIDAFLLQLSRWDDQFK